MWSNYILRLLQFQERGREIGSLKFGNVGCWLQKQVRWWRCPLIKGAVPNHTFSF